jgi:uncharacterized protein
MTLTWKAAGRFLGRHWAFTGLLLFVIMVSVTPHALERFFVYYPSVAVESSPSRVGLQYQDIFLVTEDNVRLHGWFVPHPESRHTLLVFHGNAGNVGHRVPWIKMLHEAAGHVLMIDYRGYGKSEGQPFEEGLYRDARAAYEWWTRERSGSGENLVLFGESIGGSVAVDLASKVPVTGLILQSPFTTAWDMAKTILPIGLLQPLAGIHFDSASKIAGIRCPKLIIHGDQDEVVPFRLGKKLYDLAQPPKRFYEVRGAGHNDLPWVAGEDYVAHLRDFLQSL